MTTHPTALGDQVQAAHADALTRLKAVAARPGARLSYEPDHPWLAEQLKLITLAIVLGGRFCRHLAANPANPRVIHAYAWSPGLIVCEACQWLGRLAKTDDICDRCHRYSPAGLFTTIAAHGPILFTYALCKPCRTEVDGQP